MEIIRIFLASSIKEFAIERAVIGDFILMLNNILAEQGVYIFLDKCEYFSEKIVKDGKQEEYNQSIRMSHMFYMLVGEELGEYTIEEFDVAMDQFQKTGIPYIYTYFLNTPDGMVCKPEVKDFMDKLDREMKHYHSTYTHIDAVKLNILVELIRYLALDNTLVFRDGEARINGKGVLPLNNIPMYSNNQNLRILWKRLKELDAEFAETYIKASENKMNDNVLFHLYNVNIRRSDLLKQIHQIEDQTLELYNRVVEYSASGNMLTWRIKTAAQLLESGDIEKALLILSDGQRKLELKHTEKVLETELTQLKSYIAENQFRIHTLRTFESDLAKGLDESTLKTIMDCYEESIGLALRYKVEMKILLGYAQFLWEQKQYVRGIQVAEKLYSWYEYTDEKSMDYYNVCVLLGNLYDDQNVDYIRARKMFRKTIEYLESIELDEEKMLQYVLTCSNYASSLRKECNKFGKKILRIYKKGDNYAQKLIALSSKVKEPALSILVVFYNNYANFLSQSVETREEALDAYYKGFHLYEHYNLETDYWVRYDAYALLCHNFAGLLREWGNYEESEKYYNAALIYRRILVKANPNMYEHEFMLTCYYFAYSLAKLGKTGYAVELLNEARKIGDRLLEKNPHLYGIDVAMIYNSLAYTLMTTDTNKRNYMICEKYYLKAKELSDHMDFVCRVGIDIRQEQVRIRNNYAFLLEKMGKSSSANIMRKEEKERCYLCEI